MDVDGRFEHGDSGGSYGTKARQHRSNDPGASMGFRDGLDGFAGNFWLFGGKGTIPRPPDEHLNDLWEYSGGQWTWMGGAKCRKPKQESTGPRGRLLPATFRGRDTGCRELDRWRRTTSGCLAELVTARPGITNQAKTSTTYGSIAGANGHGWEGRTSIVPVQRETTGLREPGGSGNTPGARQSAWSGSIRPGDFWLFGGNGFDSTKPQELPQRPLEVWTLEASKLRRGVVRRPAGQLCGSSNLTSTHLGFKPHRKARNSQSCHARMIDR